MSTSHSSLRDPIPPDDPRYETWCLIRALIHRQSNAATEEFLCALQKGSLQLDDILKYFRGQFDALVEPIVMAVTDLAFAERFAGNLDRGSEAFLEAYKEWYPPLQILSGIEAASLETQIKILLAMRVAAWKKESFRIALENEIPGVAKASDLRSASAGPGPCPVGGTNPQGQTPTEGGPAVEALVPIEDASAQPQQVSKENAARPKLDTARIIKWMLDEGYTNPTLAKKLQTAERVVTSIRNNGELHGLPVVTKLANLMDCDLEDIYL